MIKKIAELHIKALPHTLSSKLGKWYVSCLYLLVSKLGRIYSVERDGRIVGAASMISKVILTLVVDPEWQRKGIGSELVNLMGKSMLVYTEECSVGFYKKLGFREILKIGKLIFLWKK